MCGFVHFPLLVGGLIEWPQVIARFLSQAALEFEFLLGGCDILEGEGEKIPIVGRFCD